MFRLRNVQSEHKILIDTCALHGQPLVLREGELQTEQRTHGLLFKGKSSQEK